MKKYYIILILLVTLFLLASCNQNEQSTVTYNSYLLSDNTLVQELKSSNALFAVEIIFEDDVYIQRTYVWSNQLRRDLRTDLIELTKLLDTNRSSLDQFSRNSIMSPPIDVSLFLGNQKLEFDQTSDVTKIIFAMLFAESFSISQARLRNDLILMATRLETLEILGDTEVICLEIRTKESLLLKSFEHNIVHLFSDVQSLIDELDS